MKRLRNVRKLYSVEMVNVVTHKMSHCIYELKMCLLKDYLRFVSFSVLSGFYVSVISGYLEKLLGRQSMCSFTHCQMYFEES